MGTRHLVGDASTYLLLNTHLLMTLPLRVRYPVMIASSSSESSRLQDCAVAGSENANRPSLSGFALPKKQPRRELQEADVTSGSANFYSFGGIFSQCHDTKKSRCFAVTASKDSSC